MLIKIKIKKTKIWKNEEKIWDQTRAYSIHKSLCKKTSAREKLLGEERSLRIHFENVNAHQHFQIWWIKYSAGVVEGDSRLK